jgi:pyruvate kinase
MAKSGMDIARINTKYASKEECIAKIKMINRLGKCKILFDIKGLEMIDWLKTQKFDYLAVSFAESAKQIKEIRKILPNVKIISKIETRKAIQNIDELIKASDGIMVARGDLGKNVDFHKVPIFQKIIIRKCNKKKKMVVTATEMLLSMTNSKMPERAEVSDVANAVLDGSDALMLSEETAIGKYPVLAVKTMNLIIKETERNKKLLKR